MSFLRDPSRRTLARCEQLPEGEAFVDSDGSPLQPLGGSPLLSSERFRRMAIANTPHSHIDRCVIRHPTIRALFMALQRR